MTTMCPAGSSTWTPTPSGGAWRNRLAWKRATAKDWNLLLIIYCLLWLKTFTNDYNDISGTCILICIFISFIYFVCMIFLTHFVLLFSMYIQYDEGAFSPGCGQSSCLAAGLPDWSPSWSPPLSSCPPRSSCVWTYLWQAPDEDNNRTNRDLTHLQSLKSVSMKWCMLLRYCFIYF